MRAMHPKGPVLTIDLFTDERRCLLDMLQLLDEADWQKSSACPGWNVKDLAAHVLGDDLNNLSGGRDGFRESFQDFDTWEALVAFINQRNQQWVEALRRLSPRVLIELLEASGVRVYEHFRSLDPMAPGPNVAWAGDGAMPYWLHLAREYTERWVHQQQIRAGLGLPGLRERRFVHPVLSTFVHALPRTFGGLSLPDGTKVRVTITGEGGAEWSLVSEGGGWSLYDGWDGPSAATVETDDETAWLLFTRGISRAEAEARVSIEGNHALGARFLDAVAMIV